MSCCIRCGCAHDDSRKSIGVGGAIYYFSPVRSLIRVTRTYHIQTCINRVRLGSLLCCGHTHLCSCTTCCRYVYEVAYTLADRANFFGSILWTLDCVCYFFADKIAKDKERHALKISQRAVVDDDEDSNVAADPPKHRSSEHSISDAHNTDQAERPSQPSEIRIGDLSSDDDSIGDDGDDDDDDDAEDGINK